MSHCCPPMAGKRVESMATWTAAFELNARTYSKYGKPLKELPASCVSVWAAAKEGRIAMGAESNTRRSILGHFEREPCLVFNLHLPLERRASRDRPRMPAMLPIA